MEDVSLQVVEMDRVGRCWVCRHPYHLPIFTFSLLHHLPHFHHFHAEMIPSLTFPW